MPEPMDVEKVLDGLDRVICLQAQSLLRLSLLAGSLRGLGAVALKARLGDLVLTETQSLVQLAEKASALGGRPVADVGRIEVDTDAGVALPALLQHEQQTIAAMHAVIPATGEEARSEALEHFMEHLILRKQQQVDFLWHAADLDEPLAPVDAD